MATHDPQSIATIASANALNVVMSNPGLVFTPDQFQAMNAGTFVVVGPGSGRLTFPGPGTPPSLTNFGCITCLRYGDSDTDLVLVVFDSGDVLRGPGLFGQNVINLNDFRETFKDAACCGHGINACHDSTSQVLSMVNVYPCQCTCDKRN